MASGVWDSLPHYSLSLTALPLHHTGPKLQASPHTDCLHPGNLGCQPDPRAPGSKEISISVHFGLVLAYSHHLQHSSLGTRQRHPKNWLDEPLEHDPALGCWLLWYVEKTSLEKNSGKEGNSTPRNWPWNYSQVSVVFRAGGRIIFLFLSPWLLDWRGNKWTQEISA